MKNRPIIQGKDKAGKKFVKFASENPEAVKKPEAKKPEKKSEYKNPDGK